MPNGLHLVTEQVPGSRTFSVGFFVGVGSRHETPQLHGASHFLEHVLFKGTRRRTAEQISAAIEAVGGDLNAYTAKEHTCFYGRVLDTHAELSIDVLMDMLSASTVRAEDVAAERAVIIDEIAMHADDPGETAHEMVARRLFGDAGIGRPVIGSLGSISSLSRAQIVRHWRRHYQPASMAVAAAGQVDHDRLVELLSRWTGPPTVPATRVTTTTTARPGPDLVVLNRRLEQCTAVLAYGGRGIFDDRRYPLGLLTLIVGGGMSSRLFVEVRERRGLSYGIEADETGYSDGGQWTVEWQCAPERLTEITRLVKQVLTDVAANGVTEAELERAKGQMRGQTLLSYEGAASRMSRLGVNALLGDRRTLSDLLDRYAAVTASEVAGEAAEMFAVPPVLGVVGPRVARRPLSVLLQDWP